MQNHKTGILLSGGMDSIALAYWKRPQYSFTIDYGQKAAQAEIHASEQISRTLNIEHHIIRVDCSKLGSGDMAGGQPLSIAPIKEWWPYRNQLLVTLACMKGVGLGLNELMVGSVSTDDGHLDGTEAFYTKLSDLVSFQEGQITISCPSINIDTTELIKKSGIPISQLLWAHSCHTSSQPCMHCNGCKKYLYILQELGID